MLCCLRAVFSRTVLLSSIDLRVGAGVPGPLTINQSINQIKFLKKKHESNQIKSNNIKTNQSNTQTNEVNHLI